MSARRSEEHTSELQSLRHLVCRLLLARHPPALPSFPTRRSSDLAYDDASGVTREFNRNILAVVNRELDADFQPEAFAHVAFYNGSASRVEMHLVPDAPQLIHVRAQIGRAHV